mgnify:CR=1 FL=1
MVDDRRSQAPFGGTMFFGSWARSVASSGGVAAGSLALLLIGNASRVDLFMHYSDLTVLEPARYVRWSAPLRFRRTTVRYGLPPSRT